MKIKAAFVLLSLLALMAATVRAQQPTPSPDKLKEVKTKEVKTDDSLPSGEETFGNYTVTSSIEVGVRGLDVSGDDNKYRSDLNYRPGVRLFDSSFLVRSKENKGAIFDTLLLNSTGWGGDPNGYLRINAEKTGWYEFDANVRRFTYFNNLRTLALNQHTFDTRHTLGDFDLTLLPQNEKIRFHLGYSPDRSHGLGATTYDFSRDEFPIMADVRTRANNYRFGVDAKLWVFDLSFLQGFRRFRDDTTYFINTPQPGNNPTNLSRIDTLARDLPTRGHTSFTRFSIHTLLKKRFDFTGRFIYTNARTRFTQLEAITGRAFNGNFLNLDQSVVTGEAERPNGAVDLGFTWLATDKLRISDTFRANNFRITGSNLFNELVLARSPVIGALPPSVTNTTAFRLTRYRQFSNLIEFDYQFNKKYAVHAGYRHTDRRIELEGFDINLALPPPAAEEPEIFNNNTNGFIAGFRAQPVPEWTIFFDAEKGSSDNVFTRLSNNDFTNFRVRTRINPNSKLSINLSLVTRDNNNASFTEDLRLSPTAPPQNLDVDIKQRTFSGSLDWTPNSKFSLSTGYTRSNVTSDAGIILFINNVERIGTSRYFMRDNFFFANAFIQPHPRVTLFASYRTNNDPGQGDRLATSPVEIISSYPYRFQSPEVRLAFKITDRIDWNVGYQYYDYREKYFIPTFANLILAPVNLTPANPTQQNYHAHLPYTSLRIYFGRRGQ